MAGQEVLAARLIRAQELLETSEEVVPENVRRVVEFLATSGQWFQLSRNVEAGSCRDAARKRYRLGGRGIPIYDELKSFLGHYISEEGDERYVLAHCRGHQNLDLGKLRAVLPASSTVRRLEDAEAVSLGMQYGTVNPFSIQREMGPKVTQVFDQCLIEPWGVPGTMMTNAGDLTWAVEFDCGKLLSSVAFTDWRVGDIVEDTSRGFEPAPVTIGIITGNSPEAGISLWRHINEGIKRQAGFSFHGDISLPKVIVYSFPEMGLSMELQERETVVWDKLGKAVRDLCSEGVDILALACHTTHYFSPQIVEIVAGRGVRFVSIADAVREWLSYSAVSEVALVGIPTVADFGKWSIYRDLPRIVRVEPIAPETLRQLHDLAYQIKREGVNESGLQRLRNIIQRDIKSKHILIALTELSNLLEAQRRPGKSGKVLVDTLAVYGEKIANLCLTRMKPFGLEGFEPRG